MEHELNVVNSHIMSAACCILDNRLQINSRRELPIAKLNKDLTDVPNDIQIESTREQMGSQWP